VWEKGTTPVRLTSPTVGLMPTRPLLMEGDRMDPDVSLPMVTVACTQNSTVQFSRVQYITAEYSAVQYSDATGGVHSVGHQLQKVAGGGGD